MPLRSNRKPKTETRNKETKHSNLFLSIKTFAGEHDFYFLMT